MNEQSEEGEINEGEESDWEEKNNKNKKLKKKTNHNKKNQKLKPNAKLQFTSSTYRKEKCEFYNKGSCTKGQLCTYSHDFQPQAYKKMCKFFLTNSCSKDTTCQFSHNTANYPCRFFHIDGKCQLGMSCRFSHMPIEVDFYEQFMKDNKDHIVKLYKQNRLINQNLMEFIKEQIPKKQTLPPPLMTKEENKPKQVMLKKDPRQRMAKSTPVSATETKEEETIRINQVKEQKQQEIQLAKQNVQELFLTNLKRYLYSYY